MNRSISGISSGFPALDKELPLAGWPVGALTEVLVSRVGHGELKLVAPLLRRLTAAGRTVALLVPPYLAYAPALIQHGVRLDHVRVIRHAQPLDGLWQIEKNVQEGEFAAIVAVLPPQQHASGAEGAAHSLQLAARLSACPAFLFHTCSTPETTQSAQLRLLADMTQPGIIQVQRIAADAPQGHGSVQLDSVHLEVGRPEVSRHVPATALPGTAKTLKTSLRATVPTRQASADPEAAQTPQPVPNDTLRAPAQPTRGNGNAPGRSMWPFKQRRPGTPNQGGSQASSLALLFSRGWNA